MSANEKGGLEREGKGRLKVRRRKGAGNRTVRQAGGGGGKESVVLSDIHREETMILRLST